MVVHAVGAIGARPVLLDLDWDGHGANAFNQAQEAARRAHDVWFASRVWFAADAQTEIAQSSPDGSSNARFFLAQPADCSSATCSADEPSAVALWYGASVNSIDLEGKKLNETLAMRS
jgi:hypothetical protein